MLVASLHSVPVHSHCSLTNWYTETTNYYIVSELFCFVMLEGSLVGRTCCRASLSCGALPTSAAHGGRAFSHKEASSSRARAFVVLRASAEDQHTGNGGGGKVSNPCEAVCKICIKFLFSFAISRSWVLAGDHLAVS
jgi:hypothetical protein